MLAPAAALPRFVPRDWRHLLFPVLAPKHGRHYRRLRSSVDAEGYSLQPFVEHRCIFVHVPKCAGVSVARSLFGNLAGGHLTIPDYRVIFSRQEFAEFFKFTFVRNPWDRLVSAFHFLKQGGLNDDDRAWTARHLAPFRDFREFVTGWVNLGNIQRGIHFRPQHQFLAEPHCPAPPLDFVGRFERLTEDFDLVARRLGIAARLIESNQTIGRARDFREYYTPETRQIVAQTYAADIERLEYEFDDAAPSGTR